jgi:hypothetical protein
MGSPGNVGEEKMNTKFVLILSLSGAAILAACMQSPSDIAATYGGACTLDQGGGLLGKISSPYVRAKADCSIIGQPVDSALAILAAPTNSYTSPGGTQTLTWNRVQSDNSFGTLSCSETVTVAGGTVRSYRQTGGNC